MRIFREARSPSATLQNREGGIALRRSEVVSDIFNNRSDKKDTEGDVKLRLSHASRRISEGLRQRVSSFLKDEPELAQALEEIPLEEEGVKKGASQSVRRMSTYLQWVHIRGASDEGGELTEAELPYAAVQALGKDEEMASLFKQRETDHEKVQEERKRQAPHYYYMAFPEVYSFN